MGGVSDVARDYAQRHYVQALYHLTKALDTTRPVIGNDGWEHVVSDIYGIHDYTFDGATLRERYERLALDYLERAMEAVECDEEHFLIFLTAPRLAPGGTDIADRMTPRQLIRPGVMADEGADAQAEQHLREMAEDIRNQQALRRRGLPEEQAAAIAFLASDDATFITGQVINCSGGQS